ncbi:hypothetical protein NW759_009623 [Fusarium solani]|nr:hypothetical protein NW759_009623 [Fusarium solani]
MARKPRGLSLPFALALTLTITIVNANYRPRWTRQDPCPDKINAVIPVGSPFGNHEAVHEAMKTCTNITELSIYTGFFGCTGFPDRYSLPFALDGSDRYLSAPQVLTLDAYEFDYKEWQSVLPPRPHWSNDDGSWPSSSSSNSIVVMAVGLYYHARWSLDHLFYPLMGIFRGGKWWEWWTSRESAEWWWWWNSGKAAKWYRGRRLPAEYRSKDNMDLWLEAMDFSHVHTLSIKQHGTPKPKGDTLFHRLPLALTSLRSLTIGGRWVDWKTELERWEAEPGPLPKQELKSPRPPRALDFIMALPASSLTNFTWIESATVDVGVFDAVLQHHGPSLRQLKWINAEVERDPRPTLSTEQLQNLGKWAPGLADLTIDLDREQEDWPREKLRTLGKSLPKLKNLTIYLNLEAVNGQNETMHPITHYDFPFTPQSLSQPLLDANGARDMFLLLQEFQPEDELETLLLREGGWDGLDDLATRSHHLWSEGLRNWARCTILGEDGDRLKDGPRCYAEYNVEYERFKEGRQGEGLY